MKPMAMAVTGAALAAGASRLFAEELEPLLPKLGSENLDEQKAARETFESACLRAGRPGAEAERADAARTVAALLDKDIPATTRVWLLRQLWLIGGAECVAAIVQRLGHEDAETRDAARRALQKNPSPEAAAALCAALEAAKEPGWRLALLNALGGRRERANAAAVAKCLADADPGVASAAAAALARIGGPDAAKALAAARDKAAGPLRAAVADALVRCAQTDLAEGRYAEAEAAFKEVEAAAETDLIREAGRRGVAAADLSKKAGRPTYP